MDIPAYEIYTLSLWLQQRPFETWKTLPRQQIRTLWSNWCQENREKWIQFRYLKDTKRHLLRLWHAIVINTNSSFRHWSDDALLQKNGSYIRLPWSIYEKVYYGVFNITRHPCSATGILAIVITLREARWFQFLTTTASVNWDSKIIRDCDCFPFY